jgi:hypothetical protein
VKPSRSLKNAVVLSETRCFREDRLQKRTTRGFIEFCCPPPKLSVLAKEAYKFPQAQNRR